MTKKKISSATKSELKPPVRKEHKETGKFGKGDDDLDGTWSIYADKDDTNIWMDVYDLCGDRALLHLEYGEAVAIVRAFMAVMTFKMSDVSAEVDHWKARAKAHGCDVDGGDPDCG